MPEIAYYGVYCNAGDEAGVVIFDRLASGRNRCGHAQDDDCNERAEYTENHRIMTKSQYVGTGAWALCNIL